MAPFLSRPGPDIGEPREAGDGNLAMSAPAPAAEHRIRLPDGRRLVCAEYGRPGLSFPVLYLHGFLGSRLEPRIAGDLGLHLFAPDRPGYGASDPMPEHSLRRFGADMGAALDALGIGVVAVVGVSAGGPYALAIAAALGPRVRRLALVAAVANKKVLRREGGAVRLMHLARRRGRFALGLAPVLLRHLRLHGLDETVLRLILLPERPLLRADVDVAELERLILVSLREGTRRGLAGAEADLENLTRRWDVRPEEVRCPTLVLHGGRDHVVPVGHAHWYASRLPAARLEIVAEAGHISLAVNEAARIAAFVRSEA
jgi:pimeloyl-ACP methyl ester carboxylesterase